MQDGLEQLKKLEEFIKDNRNDLDEATPSFKIWERLEQELDAQEEQKVVGKSHLKVVSSARKTTRLRVLRYAKYASIAAVGLVLLLVGGVIGSRWTATQGASLAEVSLSDVSDEYAEVEQHYAQQVNLKIEELKKRDFDQSILDDIAELDEAFQELKQELGKTGSFSDEEIILAMVENYQMKIEILERVLERMEARPQGKVSNSSKKQQKNI